MTAARPTAANPHSRPHLRESNVAAVSAPPMDSPRRRRSRVRLFLITFAVAIVLAVVLFVTLTRHSGPSRTDTAPVDLATHVDMANGVAHKTAVVRMGDARIEVLSATLLRLEYAPSGHFENTPTVNALNRRMPVPTYSARITAGWLTLRTSRATLRYRVGSGPFTPANTSVQYAEGTQNVNVHPTWDWECTFDETCQAGAAVLQHGAGLKWGQSGYQSSAGYINLSPKGASARWTVLGAPRAQARLSIRYSDVLGSSTAHAAPAIDVLVDGIVASSLALPATSRSQPWSTVTTTAVLKSGSSVEVRCVAAPGCNLDIDTLSVGGADAPTPMMPQTSPLGGWVRGFDTFTYASEPTCAPGTAGATCANTFEPLHTDGLLDQAGWRLLDDTQSDVWTKAGWIAPRARNGDVEDGYLFVYGHNYTGALRTLAQLTGPAPLLPRNIFGVWYSDYTPYSSQAIEGTVYPDFQANDVPLNTLSLDTDWKAPNNWNGWEWNTSLFPHPTQFLQWAKSEGIAVTLNIHSGISVTDPDETTAQNVAGNTMASSSCMVGICLIWNWSSVAQAESNFDIQQPLQKQGVSFFWLDWCCDFSTVSMPGVTPDSWIDHLYAQDMVNAGQRGFLLGRIGSSNGNPQRVYVAGPWSNHTSAIAFTGDAWGTWTTLAQEVALTPDEATIGEPYVSDDVGSFLGPPPQTTQDPADLYDRWVQFGTFQPILRLHSNDEQRLPWQYPQPVRSITESFLRLREALIPYTYTLAAQAHFNGMPISQPLYLQYPGDADAYAHPGEYLYGANVLVAPVTSPGDPAQTTIWFPPGRWVDYFTGATFTGPTTATMTVPLNRMPVFVRAGGIITEDPLATPTSHPNHLDVKVYSGSSGAFTFYDDSGTGLGYTKGQYTETQITDSAGAPGATDAMSTVTIAEAHGHYPGEPHAMTYEVDVVDLTQPSSVSLNGTSLPPEPAGSSAPGWSYQRGSDTVVITTPPLSTDHAATIAVSGARAVDLTEPQTTS